MAITYQYSLFIVVSLVAHSVAGSEWDASDVQAQNEAGAAGKSGGGGMSNGGMIALCVIVGVVVILGFSSAALFYVAKKRQWQMREKISRSAKQVAQAIKTPLTATFPRSQRLPTTSGGKNKSSRDLPMTKPQRKPTDVEKGAVITTDVSSQGSQSKSRGWASYFSFNRS
ncbi:uncharacterized protein APUU_80431A [Aspergillus puulaauensis]|uniref:Transmembrane protein n=1 Tax=Aspergillus puulaauensis TaxID=1220207 RepID=A0A7R8AUQ4_9EURO|nr:uncharacterized protein APUU_80431A [Aspergillus puulaauensis]BCS30128.1 hypothetical protein APUU_80431A [Aspergillus puulaauensis]